jgi:hypothetical protein
MEFLASLHTDVKLLLVGGALALLAALLSDTKGKEYRYMAVFALCMGIAGVRYNQQQAQDIAEADQQTQRALAQPAARGKVRTIAR